MKIVHAGEHPPDGWQASIFLAGPTPRQPDVASWRPDALAELERQWQGPGELVVFVPEPADGARYPSYDNQIAWEERWLDAADAILFWVPRDMSRLPGLTTNVEFGRYESSGRVVFGAPDEAEHVRYLKHHARQHGAPVTRTLPDTVKAGLELIGPGAYRTGGERHVPLLALRTPSFQNWLATQRNAGNELLDGRLLWTYRSFLWAFHARIRVAAEDRVKQNEVVIGRPDVVSIVAYRPKESLRDNEVVLVREFRTPSCAPDGHVLELPGGGVVHGSPLEHAVAELVEETGLRIEPERLRQHQVRQAVATLSAHRVHVFSVELTEDEIGQVRADGTPHGIAADSERTYADVYTFGQILDDGLADWTTVGVLTAVLTAPGR